MSKQITQYNASDNKSFLRSATVFLLCFLALMVADQCVFDGELDPLPPEVSEVTCSVPTYTFVAEDGTERIALKCYLASR